MSDQKVTVILSQKDTLRLVGLQKRWEAKTWSEVIRKALRSAADSVGKEVKRG